jgi:hypothetical protein
MIQTIFLELVRLFSKRHKYTDFDWVVRSAIRKRSTDCFWKIHKKNSRLVREIDTKERTLDFDSLTSDKSIKTEDEVQRKRKIIEFIIDVQEKIAITGTLRNHFNDWDRELLEVALELFTLEQEVDKKSIMECMGFLPEQESLFVSKIMAFRKKFERYFGDVSELLG